MRAIFALLGVCDEEWRLDELRCDGTVEAPIITRNLSKKGPQITQSAVLIAQGTYSQAFPGPFAAKQR